MSAYALFSCGFGFGVLLGVLVTLIAWIHSSRTSPALRARLEPVYGFHRSEDAVEELRRGTLRPDPSDEPKAECVPADGDLDARGISWRVVTTEPVTADELRGIASQLHAAATALENR